MLHVYIRHVANGMGAVLLIIVIGLAALRAM
jgi:hypothetical protein